VADFAPYRDQENVASKTNYAMIRLESDPRNGDLFIAHLAAAPRYLAIVFREGDSALLKREGHWRYYLKVDPRGEPRCPQRVA